MTHSVCEILSLQSFWMFELCVSELKEFQIVSNYYSILCLHNNSFLLPAKNNLFPSKFKSHSESWTKPVLLIIIISKKSNLFRCVNKHLERFIIFKENHILKKTFQTNNYRKSKCPLCVNVSFVTLCNVSSPNPSSCVKQMWLYVFYLCTAICQ